METTAYIALSRAVALDRQMTNVANNLANTGTSGYRAEHSDFKTILENSGSPQKLAFVQDQGMIRDETAGAIEQTGNDLDLAIAGDAYFVVQTPNGNRYTRAGHFQLDQQSRIVTSDGALLLDENDAPITLPEQPGKVAIGPDGSITTDQGQQGKVGLVNLANPDAMQREEGSRYATDEVPTPAVNATVVQGSIERSNVQPIREITLMIDTQRAFEGSIRLIETHHELERKAVEKITNVQA